MAIRDLFFSIVAKDETGKAFESVSRGLRGVEGAARSAGERVRATAQSIAGGAAKASAASAGLGFAFRDAFRLFDQQAIAQATVVRAVESTAGAAGKTADELFRAASALQAVTRFGDETILADVTAQLLTFTNISGDVFDRATESVLDVATVMGTDLRSASVQLGKALNDPVKGLGALSRSGIQFSEDQKRVIESLVATGDVAAAQAVILDEIATQFGGQARAAAEAGIGPVVQLSNAWGDLKEEVGGTLAPLLAPVVDVLTDAVAAFADLSPGVKRFAVVAGGLAVVLPPIVAGLGLMVAGIAAAGAPVALIAAGIGTVTAALVAFWPEIRGFASTVAEAFTTAADFVAKSVERIREWLVDRLRGAFDFVMDKVGAVKAVFFDLYDAVVGNSYVPDMVDGIAEHFGRLDSVMVDPAVEAAETVSATFDDMARGVGDAFAGMVRDGDFSLRRLGDSLRQVGANALGSGLDTLVGAGVDGLLNVARSAAAVGPTGPVLPGFANGADFVAGGLGGIDRNVAAFRVSRGERVTVTPEGASAGGGPVVVNISTPDPAAFSASRAQVAAQVARAVARGRRSL